MGGHSVAAILTGEANASIASSDEIEIFTGDDGTFDYPRHLADVGQVAGAVGVMVPAVSAQTPPRSRIALRWASPLASKG